MDIGFEKNWNWHYPPGLFFEKCFYYILSKLFSKLNNIFQKCFQMVFQKPALRYFRMCEAFLLSLACFIAFLHMCEPRVVRFNFCYTFVCSYICCSWKVIPLSFQNAWHHPSYWFEPRLSIEGKYWMRIP